MTEACDRDVQNTLHDLDVQPTRGLDSGEVDARRERCGPNQLRAGETSNAWETLFAQFKSMIVVILAVATGMETQLGQISEMAESAEKEAAPLQRRLDKLGTRLAWITLAIAAFVAVVGMVAGQDTMLMIQTAIALGVAAIPEGLPIVATIALANGMWHMARRQALINQLPAVETLGATRVIFTDKTGTLTQNRMMLRKVVTPADEVELEANAVVLITAIVLDVVVLGALLLGVTAMPPSGGGLVESLLFSLDAVFNEGIPLAV